MVTVTNRGDFAGFIFHKANSSPTIVIIFLIIGNDRHTRHQKYRRINDLMKGDIAAVGKEK